MADDLDDGDEPGPPSSKELEARYRALVGDEPDPLVKGLGSGAKMAFVLVAGALVSASIMAMCGR